MSGKPSSSPRRAWRLLRNALLAVVLIVIALLLFVQYGLGFAVRNGAKAAGPSLIGTPITIGSTHFRPLTGIVELGDLVIGAPEGFKANVFEMKSFRLIFEPKSLLSDTIVVKEIVIADPMVSYELSGLSHNIGAILKKLEGDGSKPDESEAEPKAGGAGKKVIIEHFVFSGAKIRIASTALGGKGAVIPMPVLELRDIGKKSGGATTLDVVREILNSVAKGILGAVKDGAFAIGGFAVDAVGATGGAAIHAAEAAGAAAVKTAGAVGDAAIDAAGAVGGAALDAAGAVGGAAVGGVKAVGGAIGGLLGGRSKAVETNAAPAATGPESEAKPDEESRHASGVMAVGEAAIDTVSGVGGAAVRTVGAVGGATLDTAAAVGGAAVGGVKAVGGAAVGGVKAVGGAAVGGVKAIGGAVGSVFGDGDKAATNTTGTATPK